MKDFDDLNLADLLPTQTLTSLGNALTALLGGRVALLDGAGALIWGELADGAARAPLVLELEPVAYLAASAPPSMLSAAAAMLTQVLHARARYLMAASVHHATVNSDFEVLRRKHEALVASEARYRKLSEELEQRVAQQVGQLEQQRLRLYQMEKLASVGQLAAGVAHEINNPISYVRSNLNSLKTYLEQLGALKSRLDETAWREMDLEFLLSDGTALVIESMEGIDRVGRIVRDLKGFANVEGAEREMANLNDNLHLAVKAIAGQKPAGVQIVFDLQPLPPLQCQPAHLNQVFCALLTNALQAVGNTGQITVSSRADEEAVTISIEDDGVGIATENLSRVFEPFFTTRDVGRGMGLGLTVARDVVMAHHGSIALESTPGAGTRAIIRLPFQSP